MHLRDQVGKVAGTKADSNAFIGGIIYIFPRAGTARCLRLTQRVGGFGGCQGLWMFFGRGKGHSHLRWLVVVDPSGSGEPEVEVAMPAR